MCGVQDLYVLMVTITTMIELYTGRFFYCLKRKNIVCGQKLVPLKNNMRQIKSRVRHVPYAFHCHLKLKTVLYPLFISQNKGNFITNKVQSLSLTLFNLF